MAPERTPVIPDNLLARELLEQAQGADYCQEAVMDHLVNLVRTSVREGASWEAVAYYLDMDVTEAERFFESRSFTLYVDEGSFRALCRIADVRKLATVSDALVWVLDRVDLPHSNSTATTDEKDAGNRSA